MFYSNVNYVSFSNVHCLTLIQSPSLLSGIGLLQLPTSMLLIFLKGKSFQGLT